MFIHSRGIRIQQQSEMKFFGVTQIRNSSRFVIQLLHFSVAQSGNIFKEVETFVQTEQKLCNEEF